MRTILSVMIAAFAVCVISCGGGLNGPRGGTQPGARPIASESDQAARAKAIRGFLDLGILHKVEIGKPPVVWVTASFHALNYDDKVQCLSIVAAHVFAIPPDDWPTSDERLLIVDSITGRDVGHFGMHGLSLD